jgi:sugar lactone lactonase YvrE
VQQVLRLTRLTDVLEGIAIDHRGNIFVTHGRLVGETRTVEILQIAPRGGVSVFATLEHDLPPNLDFGGVGLVLDSKGDLYAGLSSGRPATHGVWRIRRDGSAQHLAGSEAIVFPDGLTFDARGNLYVTDVRDGAIWRFPPAGQGSLWLKHDLLAPITGFGANGIVFVPPSTLYVANTDQGLIARVPIRPNGNPGLPTVAAQAFELLTIDGLTTDAHGDLYGAIILHSVLGTAPLERVDPRTGTITPVTDQADMFDLPTSPTFGAGPLDHKSLFVVNSGFFPEDRPEASPGVVRVRVGAPGVPAH